MVSGFVISYKLPCFVDVQVTTDQLQDGEVKGDSQIVEVVLESVDAEGEEEEKEDEVVVDDEEIKIDDIADSSEKDVEDNQPIVEVQEPVNEENTK